MKAGIIMSKNVLNKPVSTILSSQEKFLTGCLTSIQRILETAPERSLRIHHRNGILFYGTVKDHGPETYLSPKSPDLQKYIDKYCAERMLPLLTDGIRCIEKSPLLYDSEKITKELDRLDQLFGDRTPLFVETRERHVKRWAAKEYKRNPYPMDPARTYYNDKKEPFRSKNELYCSQLIEKLGLAFRYEAPLLLSNGKTAYPDFTVMSPRNGLEYYIEILGMMSDSAYVKDNLKKTQWYMESGIYPGDRLILFFESEDVPFDFNGFEDTLRKLFL